MIPTIDLIFQYTLEDLQDNVQASENELREGLEKLEALEIDGELKNIDENFA